MCIISKDILMWWKSCNKNYSWRYPCKAPFLNPSAPSATFLCQWTGSAYLAPSHYLNQCQAIVNWTPRNKLQWNFFQDTKFFIHENASENNVCEMVAILFRGRWVKLSLMEDRCFSLSYIVNIMAADDLSTQGARVLKWLVMHIISSPGGLIILNTRQRSDI